MSSLFFGVRCIAASLTFATLGLAQSYQGGVRGRVTDGTGAAVLRAECVLTNQATGFRLNSLSNEAGEYSFPRIDPGGYSLTVEAKGFKKYSRHGIAIATQQFTIIDVALELGAVTESVTVTEDVAPIETSSASHGNVISRRLLEDLPIISRNPFEAAIITPNVVPQHNPTFTRMQDQNAQSNVSIGGVAVKGNNYLLDGVPITDTQHRAILVPTIEAVAEVSLQTHHFDAEVGRTNGATFNTLLKSGGNELHGSAFGYYRPGSLAANSFFNNRAGTAKPEGLAWRNYGFSIGGPIWLPKLYDGRNRTFFWIAGEGYRQKSNPAAEMPVPTLRERAGDFSQSFTASGAQRLIHDPLSATSGNRTPFAGNVIPNARLNPIGVNVAQYWPAPSIQNVPYGANNFRASTVLVDRGNQISGKFDHEFARWWRMNLSYLHYNSRETGSQWYGNIASAEGWTTLRWADATQINSIFIPSPSMVVSVRYGFNRFPNDDSNLSANAGFDPTTLGFPSSLTQQFQIKQFPGFNFQDFSVIGGGGAMRNVLNSKNFLTSLSKLAGKHDLKAGFDYRRMNAPFINLSIGAGNYSFNQNFTAVNPAQPRETGSDVAALLLGYPDNGSASLTTPFRPLIDYYGFYLQDAWRVSPKFTLHMGLRYEYETGLQEPDRNFSYTFDASAKNPIQDTTSPATAAPGGLVFAGVNGAPERQGNPSAFKFSPRFGVAYAMNSKTTIRGGYGIYWGPYWVDETPAGIAADGFSRDTVFSTVDPYRPVVSLSNPFPNGLLKPVGNTLGLLTNVGFNVNAMNAHRRGPMTQQFSFDIQRQLPYQIGLEVGYIGSRASRVPIFNTGNSSFNINALPPANFDLGTAALQANVPNPFAGSRYADGFLTTATLPRYRLLKPHPQFNEVRAMSADSNTSRYDSLVVKGQKRMTAGLTFTASLTYARAYDMYVEGGRPQNPYDLQAEYTTSPLIPPVRFTSGFSYQLPFGKGQRYASSAGALDYLLGGWAINGIAYRQSGQYIQVFQNTNNNSLYGFPRQRPNATGVSPATQGDIGKRIDGWINPAAFSAAPRATFGNLARTIPLRGAGRARLDLSLFKNTRIHERFTVQFRFEMFNATNTPMFGGAGGGWGAATFGKISNTVQGTERNLQFGLRFLW